MASECLVNESLSVEASEVDQQESKDQESSINSGIANTEGSVTQSSSGSTSVTSHVPPKSAEERLHQMQLAQKQAEEKRLQHMMERKQKIEDNRRRDEERRKKAMEKRRELDEQRANRLMAAEAALETASDSAQQRMATSCYVSSGSHQLSTEGNNLTTRRSTNKTDSQHIGLRSVSSHRAATNTSPRVGSGTSAVSRRHSHLGPAFGSSTPRDICTMWGSGGGGGGISSGVVRSASSTPHPHAVSTTSSPRHRHSGCHIPRAVDPFSPFDRWRSCSELRIANAAACNTSRKRNAVSIKGHVSSVKANSRVRSATTSCLPGRMTRSLHTFASTNTETRESIVKSTTTGSRDRSAIQTDGADSITSRGSPSMTKSVRLSTTPTDNITSKSFSSRKSAHGLSSPRQPVKSLTATKSTNASEESSNRPHETGRVSEPISPSGTLDKALLPSHNRVGSEPVRFTQDAAHRRTKSAAKPLDEMSKSTVTFNTMDHGKGKTLPPKMLSSTNTLSRSTLSSRKSDKDASEPVDSGAHPEPKTIRKIKKVSASATESKVESLKAADSVPPSKEASPSVEVSEEGLNKEIKATNEEVNPQNKTELPSEDKKEEVPSSAMKEETHVAISEEEEYRRKLAEQRRLKREAREKEDEERRRMLEEAKQRAAEERERMQKETIRMQELEAQRRKEEGERLEQEKELRMKQEEEERKLAQVREAEKRRQQQLEEEAIRAAEKERLERKRKVDAIMSRVNKGDSGLSGVTGTGNTGVLSGGGDLGSLDRRSLPPVMTTSAIYLNGHGDTPSMESSQCASNEEQPFPSNEVKESLPVPISNHVDSDVVPNTPIITTTILPENKTQFKSPLLQSLLGEGRLSSKNISQLRRSSGPGGSTPSIQRNGTSPPTQAVASPSDSACLNSYASDLNNTVANNTIFENTPSQSSQSQLDPTTHPSFPVRRLLPAEPGSLRTHLPTSLSAHGGLSIHCSEEQNMNKENTQQIPDLMKNSFPTVAWELDSSSTDITAANTHKTSTDQTLESCTDSQLTEELNF